MPIGSIVPFDKGVFEGTIDYDFLVSPVKLGSSDKEVTYSFSVDYKPQKVYLVINIERNKEVNPRWRVWLNDFSLTKEFKPNIDVEDSNKRFSTVIFDVSPLVRQGKNDVSVVYKELQQISLVNIGHIVFYPAQDFKTYYELMAGTMLIKPQEVLNLNCNGECYLIVRNSNKDGVLQIEDKKFDSRVDLIDLLVQKKGNIAVGFSCGNNVKASAHLLTFYNLNYVIPKIVLDVQAEVVNYSLTVKLLNEGDVDLDKVIVNVLLNGASISFKSFENVKKGELRTFTLPLQPKKGTINVRVVGIRAGYRKSFDKTLSYS
ncbi:hypothetical protein [Sulfolobus acidocaldarius]|uniref:Conserved protein n=4 Tax=Sulfolobus acidocaldarius TaxID=2285 RepID=Q4J8K4_SULAC|nr:hypothetical protein [Sulfolobus acidocaldarius]AAY80877.1 conserved protein [Sulfolobus acidocaldarius DSM 639]AGE71477.1 hypothetical protein SacN8_07585 [Sulfolobus acidocaldarius N8]AGE73750.1 hypothetical protein SacRon12I_07595 [Sulfolobus acidocaldarius Ron12/I]ALU30290.1 hypothetical protein ATY89_10285 [Sulfolobus acidocaldarius]ALU31007.1 hypothetical protein ATZ20_01840 [Sulfolobus acidocaldarius]